MRIGSGVWAVALVGTCLACDRAAPRARGDSAAVGSMPTDSVLADSAATGSAATDNAATDNGEPITPQRVPDVSVLDSIVRPTNGRDVHVASDTARGIVRRVGADPASRLLLLSMTATGTALALEPSQNSSELAAAEGLEITVSGSRTTERDLQAAPGGALIFRVHTFMVRASEGVEAHDGTLRHIDDRWYLERGRTRIPLVAVPAALTRHAGARVFLVGPLNRAPESFGVLRASR